MEYLFNFSGAGDMPQNLPIYLIVLWIVLMIWSLVWKAWALWISARQTQKGWFVVFLIVNTLGILEILYIFIFSKRKAMKGQAPSAPTSNRGSI